LEKIRLNLPRLGKSDGKNFQSLENSRRTFPILQLQDKSLEMEMP
jgi:hypothetical protein